MIDDNLITILTTLTEANMDKDRLSMITAMKSLETATLNAKTAIKDHMKRAIDDENFDNLHALEKTFDTAEELRKDISAYDVFKKDTDNIRTPENKSVNTQDKTEHQIACFKISPEAEASVNKYIKDGIARIDDDVTQAKTLYQNYCQWSKANRQTTARTNVFYQLIERAGFTKTTHNGRVYINAKIKTTV